MAKTLQQLADKASRHQQAGEFDQAVSAYKALLAREPNLPDSWYNLGYVQRLAGAYDAALLSYERALQGGVSGPEEVLVNRAVILSEHLARHDDAMAELYAALEKNPDYIPAMLNLGELLEDSGDREAAMLMYNDVLKRDSKNSLALARFAALSSIEDKNSPLIARLQRSIADPSTSKIEQADLGFALGALLDSVGAYEDAFAVIRQANHASRFSFDPNGVDYNASERESYVDRIIDSFSTAETSVQPNNNEPPIFVCGMIRTGSTLTERILSAHSEVTAGGEMDLLPTLIAGQLQSYPEVIEKKRPYDIQKIRKLYLKGLRKLHPDAKIITDKRPDNFLHIGLIKTLFPDAKIVHTKRNPLDTYLSIWFAHLDSRMTFALDFESIVHWCKQFDRLEAHWKALWPNDIHDFDYDALVADPEPEIRALLEFCELDWDEQCLSPHRSAGTIRTGNVSQIREPLYQKASGRWKNYESYMTPILDELEAQNQ